MGGKREQSDTSDKYDGVIAWIPICALFVIGLGTVVGPFLGKSPEEVNKALLLVDSAVLRLASGESYSMPPSVLEPLREAIAASELARWSCKGPLSNAVIFYRDGLEFVELRLCLGDGRSTIDVMIREGWSDTWSGSQPLDATYVFAVLESVGLMKELERERSERKQRLRREWESRVQDGRSRD